MIIGVTGLYATGKDTVAEILEEMNFEHISLSDMIREELKTRGKEVTRTNLISMGNELRTTYGANILSRKALAKIKNGENYVFTSIRNPSEVKLLQKRDDFVLVNVTAPDNVRLQRIISRGKTEKDPQTLSELQEKENQERSSDPNAQQLHIVGKMAKITLRNDVPIEKLKGKVQKLVEDNLYKYQDKRPNWDNYFMSIAEAVKQRNTCLSAGKGTVIIQEKRIISTGYNGSPKGITHCNLGGCIRCTNRHLGKIKSGVYSQPCICAHSEENAIVQAAYNGVSTRGATLYTTFTPCTNCCKMIINAGIIQVIAKVVYPDDVGTSLLKEAGVSLRILK
jgi:dCMP deaminase